jgi:hypothetical protein
LSAALEASSRRWIVPLVPSNVTLAFDIGKAELSKPPRKMLPRVIGDDEERRRTRRIVAPLNQAIRLLFYA